ncbi:hypothetical protein AJ81_10075 [Pseudothermotoga hypogea DSM 11164 = NBRC 106472]|uniref:Uncharacterized protein n=1 Tax=Pseudothermotoga hypogea DSM 11164 = NBRC 106472 TaxID=1123384 RepID=A0A0X1KUG3_9THEM|nr:hypothetical protein AJ81_10075 [Pseudothermotoga hypogea DSM 11164 = NBRC 106472]
MKILSPFLDTFTFQYLGPVCFGSFGASFALIARVSFVLLFRPRYKHFLSKPSM